MDTTCSPEKCKTIDNSSTSGSLVLMVFDDTTYNCILAFFPFRRPAQYILVRYQFVEYQGLTTPTSRLILKKQT